ncbi:MAG: hypothetical protein ACKV1O_04670, partial [Saprospiraceae bacterium]
SNILPSGFMFSVMLTLPSNSNLYCAAIFAIFVANVHQIGAAPGSTPKNQLRITVVAGTVTTPKTDIQQSPYFQQTPKSRGFIYLFSILGHTNIWFIPSKLNLFLITQNMESEKF